MKNKSINQKGISLLIMVIHFTLLLMILETAFFTLFNSTLDRVTGEKSKETARSLMEMGIVYANKMQSMGQTPEQIFPKERLKLEQIKEAKIYTYTSPPLIKGGYFTLRYYYSEGSPIKVICTGHSGRMIYSSQIK